MTPFTKFRSAYILWALIDALASSEHNSPGPGASKKTSDFLHMVDNKSTEPSIMQGSDSRSRPEVILEILFDRGLLFICVNNIGDRPAVKVSVRFNKKMLGPDGSKDISALPLFRNIEFLGPAREITTFLDTTNSYFKRKQPTAISAQVSYSDVDGRSFEVTINHDLEIYRDLAFVDSTRSQTAK